MFHVKHFLSCHQFACHEMQAEIRDRVHILLQVSRREPDIHFFPDRDMLQACSCPLIPISLSEPLADSRARKRAAVRRYADKHLTALFAHSKDSEPAMFHVKHFGIIKFVKRVFIDLTL